MKTVVLGVFDEVEDARRVLAQLADSPLDLAAVEVVHAEPAFQQALAEESVHRLASTAGRLMRADRLFFSGGEPTIHLPYVERVVAAARRLQPACKVNFDTNGFMTEEALRRVLALADSITFDLKAADEPRPGEPATGRRRFLAASVGLVAGATGGAGLAAGARLFADKRDTSPSRPIVRPPGSVPEREFLRLCVRCGECFQACPNSVLQAQGFDLGIEGLWAPRVVADWSGCEPSCNNCGQVCPTGAISKRADGIVVLYQDICMGCRYCALACPYGSLSNRYKIYNYYEGYETPYEKIGFRKHIPGTSEKCDLCLERVEKGLEPSCISSCVGHARFFGDLDDMQSEVSQLLKNRGNFVLNPEMRTEPSCYYLAQKEIK